MRVGLGRCQGGWPTGAPRFFALGRRATHRSTEAAQSLLGPRFGGTIVADAYASYKGVHPKDWQSCLAHIKTKAKELEQELALLEGQAADPQARRFCQNMQGWVHTACQAHQKLSRGGRGAPKPPKE